MGFNFFLLTCSVNLILESTVNVELSISQILEGIDNPCGVIGMQLGDHLVHLVLLVGWNARVFLA